MSARLISPWTAGVWTALLLASASGSAWAGAAGDTATPAPQEEAATDEDGGSAEAVPDGEGAATDAATTPPAAPAGASSEVTGPPLSPFRCRGEAEAIVRDLTVSEIREEIERRVANPFDKEDPDTIVAHKLCVVAELKRRVGDGDVTDWYEKAIAANPDEPGYELWFGSYMGGVRGANGPIVESAEKHFYRAIAKLEKRRNAPQVDDKVTREWTQRRLMDLYQRDGAPLVGWKAYEYEPGDLLKPGVMLSSVFQVSANTRDFYYGNEMRQYTGEAAFAESGLRLGRKLTNTERFDLIRAPLRMGWNNRLRLRHNWLGALDFEYRWFHSYKSQIEEFAHPNDYVDVKVTDVGVGYDRVIGVGSLFDIDLNGSVRYTSRTGTVEYLPDHTQSFLTAEAVPTISTFIGPDKLSLRGAYVYMAIPDIDGGMPYERDRGQVIRALHLEYALYRPVLLPTFKGGLRMERKYTRGWHWYGGVAEESQVYGLREVILRDHYFGTTIKGLGDLYDFTLQGTYYTSGTNFVDPEAPQMGLQSDPTQSTSQFRTTVALARRLIDEDITPGLPKSWLGIAPASLIMVVPVSHDKGVRGSDEFENFRVGGELWCKLYATGLGGTAFLLTAGYDYQFFYRQEKAMHMGHMALRMGW